MWFIFYILGILISYIILLGFINDDTDILETNEKLKLLGVSLLSWIIVILYIAILISLVFNKNHSKR